MNTVAARPLTVNRFKAAGQYVASGMTKFAGGIVHGASIVADPIAGGITGTADMLIRGIDYAVPTVFTPKKEPLDGAQKLENNSLAAGACAALRAVAYAPALVLRSALWFVRDSFAKPTTEDEPIDILCKARGNCTMEGLRMVGVAAAVALAPFTPWEIVHSIGGPAAVGLMLSMGAGGLLTHTASLLSGARDIDTVLLRRHSFLTLLGAAAALGPWYAAASIMGALGFVFARNAYVFRDVPSEAEVHAYVRKLEGDLAKAKGERDALASELEALRASRDATPVVTAA